MKTKQLIKGCLLIILPITCLAQVNTDATGNVGIGTSAPRGVFDVAKDGDVYLAATPNGGSPQSTFLSGHIYLAPYGPNDISYIQARRLDNSGTTSIRFRTYNAGQKIEALHIAGNGNIGIGTTTPYKKLHLYGSGDVEQQIETSDDGYASLTLMSNNKRWHWSKRPSTEGDALRLFYHDGSNWQLPYMTFFTNGNVGMANQLSIGGNVGIGTTNPTHNLQIEGAGGKTSLMVRNTAEKPEWGLEISQDANFTGSIACPGRDLQLQGGWDKNIVLGTPENQTFGGKILVPGAAVGIGTNTTGVYKLAVNGSAVFTKVVVRSNTGNWPDYVFTPTYQLPSLTEVEAFIKQHRHLPDVPSAKEVETNGLDLGDNQAVLLKKIEELTLYMIELKKENDQIKEQLQTIQKNR